MGFALFQVIAPWRSRTSSNSTSCCSAASRSTSLPSPPSLSWT